MKISIWKFIDREKLGLIVETWLDETNAKVKKWKFFPALQLLEFDAK